MLFGGLSDVSCPAQCSPPGLRDPWRAEEASSPSLNRPPPGLRVEIHALALYAFKFGLPSCFHSKKLGPSRASAVPASGSWRPPRSPNLLLENCLLIGPRLFERLSHEALHFEFVKDSRDVHRGIAEGWGAAEGRSPSARDLKVYLFLPRESPPSPIGHFDCATHISSHVY
jgi:hypothetical protein